MRECLGGGEATWEPIRIPQQPHPWRIGVAHRRGLLTACSIRERLCPLDRGIQVECEMLARVSRLRRIRSERKIGATGVSISHGWAVGETDGG